MASDVGSSLWEHWADLPGFNIGHVQFSLVLVKIAFNHLAGYALPLFKVQVPYENVPLFIGGDDPFPVGTERQGVVL